MAKQAKLKPVEIKPLGKWRVNVPSDLSETGSRRQMRFDTKGEADTYCGQLKARRDNFGGSLNSMGPARIAIAAEAYKITDSCGVDLLVAVREWEIGHKRRHQSVTFEALFDEYIATFPVGSHEKYLGQLRQTRNRFPTLRPMNVWDIQTHDVEMALAGITDGGRNSILSQIRTVFNYGIDRKYLTDNPVRKTSFKKRPTRFDREIIPPEKVSVILNHAFAHSPEIIPYLVCTFFTGIRPQDEAKEILWSDISPDSLSVRAEVAKTEDQREIPFSANAKAWLTAYVANGGATEGLVMPLTTGEWTRRRKAAYAAAGYAKIPQDGARHSFASYWLWLPVNNKDTAGLLSRMGHTTIKALKNHYLRPPPVADWPAKYWSIMPPQGATNIVGMTA